MRSLGNLSAVEWAAIALTSAAVGAALAALSASWAVPLGLLLLVFAVRVYLRRTS